MIDSFELFKKNHLRKCDENQAELSAEEDADQRSLKTIWDLWVENLDYEHRHLVNAVQGPHKCYAGYCLRKGKKDKCTYCRFHFPFPVLQKTQVVFEPHGKDSFGDIYYRTDSDETQ